MISTYAFAENSITYTSKTLKIFNGWTNFTPAEYKIDRTAGQSYYNSSNINNCTDNQNRIIVDTLCVNSEEDSPEKEIYYHKTGVWDNEEAKICTGYQVKVKNGVFSPCTSMHTGIWTHN